jgi:DHA3 family tetracycline resistance protein-like MFS transporter
MPHDTRLPAPLVYIVLSGAWSLIFALITTVNLVYQATVANLDPLQLVLVGTVLESTVFLAEVPTGIVADVYSRRLSVIIGVCLMGLGFILEGAIAQFATIVLAQVIWGLGATFMSGALEAWIADEVGEAQAGQAFLRGTQASEVGGLIGIAASVALGSVAVNVPIVVGGALYLMLGAFLALVMPETGFRPTPRQSRTTWQTMAATLRAGLGLVRARPRLADILGIGLFFGLYSEAFDRLWTTHLLRTFTFPALGALPPIIWFGIINAVAMLLSIAATEMVRRRADTDSHRAMTRALFAISALLVAAVIGFGLAQTFALAILAYWAVYLLRTLRSPLQLAWLNQSLDSGVRATVISLSSQVDALGQITGGPALGALGTATSPRVAIVAAGFVLAPVLALFGRIVRRDAG